MISDILLPQILPIENPNQYKLHLACNNQEDEPLDVFVRDRREWDGWNAWRSSRDDFSRDFIFALIDFYPERDRWLFGGAYHVISRKQGVSHGPGYKIELLKESEPLVGRLKVALKRPGRSKAFNFENYYKDVVVAEVLPCPYTGEPFCGYENINVRFSMLETIVSSQRQDWRLALQHAKGVYLITDGNTGKGYVGAAYGGTGIWSRWMCYINTGHGYNDELTHIIDTHTREYARHNFSFALLEYFTPKTDDIVVQEREKFWKDVLLTRDFGYNRN